MFRQKQSHIVSIADYGFMLIQNTASEEAAESEDSSSTLDDAARSEREYVRQRLREELKREPTEEEIDEWVRQHTEGY
ncbi:MAG TPA: hypothetical protein VGN95_20300 [Pyrinomonadaceae bacterium]|jgi:hypothetical protein|nr:hypothetical protein [Pyrinomonadaceae bacterium]